MTKKLIALFLALVMVLTVTLSATAEADKKWKEKRTPDGWIKVTNEGGATVWIFAGIIGLLAAAGIIYFIIQRNKK